MKCARCHRRKPKPGHKTCVACLAEAAKDSKKRRLRRFRRGICPNCGGRAVEPDKGACCVCLEADALRKRIKRPWEHQADPMNGQRVAKWRAKQLLLRRCTLCGREVRDVNPRTLRAFRMCPTHRKWHALRKQQSRAKET